jgi:hypothetical protein
VVEVDAAVAPKKRKAPSGVAAAKKKTKAGPSSSKSMAALEKKNKERSPLYPTMMMRDSLSPFQLRKGIPFRL